MYWLTTAMQQNIKTKTAPKKKTRCVPGIETFHVTVKLYDKSLINHYKVK